MSALRLMTKPSTHRVSRSVPLPPFRGRVDRRNGEPPGTWTPYSQTLTQSHRVADSQYDRYELFVGEDASPDFDASGQPVQTSSSLPFSWTPTPPASGTKDLHCVVRKRNEYNLVGFEVYETIRTIDDTGAEDPGPVTAPQLVTVYDGATGYLTIGAKYRNSEDNNPADTWEVYVKEGSDPVPGVDSPDSSPTMNFLGGQAILQASLGGYTPGAVAHILVCAVRSSDSERGCAAVVQHTVAELLDAVDGQLFAGEEAELR